MATSQVFRFQSRCLTNYLTYAARNVERVRGLLATHGIENVIRGNRDQEAVTARLAADSAREAEERVRAAIGDEAYAVDSAEPESPGA